ncbi:MAG TPA: hypothetical protein VF462_01460, partial [Micromonosporaceae bacterium]
MSGSDETSSGAARPVPDPTDIAGNADTDAELASTVAALAADDIEPASRRRLLGRLVTQLPRRRLGDVFRPRAAIRWISETVGEVAPYIPVRDLETLRRHHGVDGEALAERLIRNAARATAGV